MRNYKIAMRQEEYNIDTCSIRCWKNIDERDKHIEHKQKTKRAEADAYYVLKNWSVHTGEEGRAWGKCKTDDNYHRYAAEKNGAVPNLSQTRQDKDARDVNQGNKGKASEWMFKWAWIVTHSQRQSQSQSQSHCHSHSHSHPHSFTHTPTHSFTHTPTHSHSHTHTHTLTHSQSHSQSHSHTHTHTLTLTHSHTHTHTHSQGYKYQRRQNA